MTDLGILNLIRESVGYKTTVGPTDKAKVDKALAGILTPRPSSKLGQAAWELARRVASTTPPPPPPPPPPNPTAGVAPRTYNEVPGGQDARFCVFGLPREGNLYRDRYSRYDENGLDVDGGRSHTQVPGLKPANEMDDRSACSPYGSFPPWPTGSYDR